MIAKAQLPFDPHIFLTKIGEGRTIAEYRKNKKVFSQGDPADAIFYIQNGKVKLTVVSKQGKEAVIGILGTADFFGEGCLAGQPLRMATATAISACVIVRLEKRSTLRVLHDEPTFSELFLAHLLARNIRLEEDLVDQLFIWHHHQVHFPTTGCVCTYQADSEKNRLLGSASTAGRLTPPTRRRTA